MESGLRRFAVHLDYLRDQVATPSDCGMIGQLERRKNHLSWLTGVPESILASSCQTIDGEPGLMANPNEPRRYRLKTVEARADPQP